MSRDVAKKTRTRSSAGAREPGARRALPSALTTTTTRPPHLKTVVQ